MSRDDIEFVYFDLGNVLVSFDPITACENVARQFRIEVTRAQAAIYDSGLQDEFEHGRVTGPQYADRVRSELDLTDEQMPTETLLDAISAMFTPIEAMTDIIRSVVNNQKRIGILSNTCHAHWQWILRQNWSVMKSPFELQILSYEVGAMKPNSRIYQAAEDAVGISPHKILFLDDRSENIAGATQRGWHAVQCTGGQTAHDALKRFGALV